MMGAMVKLTAKTPGIVRSIRRSWSRSAALIRGSVQTYTSFLIPRVTSVAVKPYEEGVPGANVPIRASADAASLVSSWISAFATCSTGELAVEVLGAGALVTEVEAGAVGVVVDIDVDVD